MFRYLLALFAFCGCIYAQNQDCDFNTEPVCVQEVCSANGAPSVLAEDDPFGDPEPEDPRFVPEAIQKPLKKTHETYATRVLKRLGCTVIAGYLLGRDCVSGSWRRLKSLY